MNADTKTPGPGTRPRRAAWAMALIWTAAWLPLATVAQAPATEPAGTTLTAPATGAAGDGTAPDSPADGAARATVESADTRPYRVSVWSRVLFGPEGKPLEIALVDEAQYPAAFAANVRDRVARTRIPPPERAGQAVTLRSGVELRFLVTPSADGRGTVKLLGVGLHPLPLNRYLASFPKDVRRSGGWEGQATGVCQVGTEGRCTQIDVKALPGMPESVRRHVRASLEAWTFEPQQLDGQPIEGEYTLHLHYETWGGRPDDFRQDRFLRLLRQR